MGVCLAATKAIGDKADVDVQFTSDTVVGKHPIVDYDDASLYPSTKMGLNLDLDLDALKKRSDDDE
jgi:hypothetical protein